MKKKLLVIEKDQSNQEAYTRWISPDAVTILRAYTLAQGQEVFSQNSPIDLIVISDCVDAENPASVSLATEIRKTYRGMILAACDTLDTSAEMMNVEGTMSLYPWDIASKVSEILRV